MKKSGIFELGGSGGGSGSTCICIVLSAVLCCSLASNSAAANKSTR